ncbi:MAG TPA: tail fiber protein [Pyrinomonadaceae bacterium]|nr:tail fiber protein [Pyrinomonadaceae bacterium]
MSDQFVAEIRIFPFSFPPTGWAFCNGQLMPISQNTALFSLLGTTYGGDGKSTFALPNLQGNTPMQPGQGPGLSQRFLGEQSGTEFVTLLQTEIPAHTHGQSNTTVGSSFDGDVDDPSGAIWAKPSADRGLIAYDNKSPNNNQALMAPQALSITGGSLPHNNMQPYLALNFCIALQGIFPQRP